MGLNEYLKELKKVELLDAKRESELWRAYKERNDSAARQELIESYQPLVFKAALGFKLGDIVMDVIQEGTVGLIEAVENYDHARGVAFSLYALHRVRGRMLNYMKKEGMRDLTYIDKPMYNEEGEATLADLIVDPSPAIAKQAEDNFIIGELKSALQKLPLKEQLVLSEVYLQDKDPKDVAESLAVSTSYMYRLQKKGIRRVRGMLSKLMQHW